MAFSLSPFLLWISEDSVAARCWMYQPLSLSQLKCNPCFRRLGHSSCMLRGSDDRLHRVAEMMKDSQTAGRAQGGTGVGAYAPVCTITYINHILLISVSGNFHLACVTIIHSNPHLFSCFCLPAEWPFFAFIYVVIRNLQYCWSGNGGGRLASESVSVQECENFKTS